MIYETEQPLKMFAEKVNRTYDIPLNKFFIQRCHTYPHQTVIVYDMKKLCDTTHPAISKFNDATSKRNRQLAATHNNHTLFTG